MGRRRESAGRWRCDRSCKLELHAHMNATTLTALMEANRGAARSVTYLEGERDARPGAHGALHEPALGILYRSQGRCAPPRAKLALLRAALPISRANATRGPSPMVRCMSGRWASCTACRGWVRDRATS